MTQGENTERTVKCPVEGCDATKLARGIHLHVRQSKGDGHGPQGEIPEGVDLDDLETVGEQEVSIDYPESREQEQTGRKCPHCDGIFRGKQGVMIHLGRMAGRKGHPENPSDHHDHPEDFLAYDLDEDGHLIETSETPTRPSSAEGPDYRTRILEYIVDLYERGDEAEAERAREMLLPDE